MEMKCSKGDKIILTDKLFQTFEGIVKSINHESGMLLLSNVTQQPGDKVIDGYRHFDKNEIIELEIVGQKQKDTDVLMYSKVPKSIQSQIKNLQKTYSYVNKLDSNFFTALSLIRQCSKIGICLMDVSRGRCERASILAISTSSRILIFDLEILGDCIFDKGLKEILECSSIIKVVHDCRLLSDCLKHKYLIKLENVRDVEAEDIMVVHQERRFIRKHSRSLDYLVKLYLNMEFKDLCVCCEEWSRRPLKSELLEHVAECVSYLLPLHEMIEKKFLERLISASCLYNSFVRDSDIFESVHCDPKTTLREQMISLVKRQNEPRTKTPVAL